MNIESNPVLRQRFRVRLRSIRFRKNRPKALRTLFHFNVFDGEFRELPQQFDQRQNPDPKQRQLLSNIEELQQTVTEKDDALALKDRVLAEKETAVKNLNAKVDDLASRNVFLNQHVAALERETNEQNQELNAIREQNKALKKSGETDQKASKPLGEKPFSQLGRDAQNRTRAAYRKKVREEIDPFGANRRLTTKKIILCDDEGQSVPINIQKPNTYSNLTPAEKAQVAAASAYKDRNRLSDKVYSEMTKLGDIPKAAHVKQFEK